MTTPELDPVSATSSAVLEAWHSDEQQGLTSDEAASRLASHGPNELRPQAQEPWWRKLLRQFQDPLVYLLFVAMAISLAAWAVEGAHGVPIDVVVILAILLANAAIGLSQEAKAENAVAALSRMTRASSTVVRDGRQKTVPSGELVPGDVLVLAEGDAVGADARLLSATALKVQESSLTGESEAVTKRPDPIEGETALGDRTNMVFKGTAVVQGVGRAVVTSTGMGTQMGTIATLLDSTEAQETPLTREIDKVSKMLGGLVIAIAILTMGALLVVNGVHDPQDLVDTLLIGVSLAVAAVPEGMPAILSLVLAVGVQALSRRNAVMKNLHSVETLGSASVICSDKTGTLTRNEMTLHTVVTAHGRTDLSGVGYAPTGEVDTTSSEVALEGARLAVFGGAVANNSQLEQNSDGEWTIVGDPTEAAFLVAWPKLANEKDPAALPRLGEVPFSSDRKMMSVGVEREEGNRLYSKGAPDVLLVHCDSEWVDGEIVPLDDEGRARIAAVVEDLSGEGYRTLGIAFRQIDDDDDVVDEDDEEGLTFVGVAGIIDPPREEVSAAIAEAHGAGIRTVMITGDHPVTAARIASDLGIADSPRAMTGLELDELDEEGFRRATREVNVYARVAPEHKLRIVDALQADGQVVAMTGDGVNDAPALKSSDIGVAMGITGTEVTKEAATMVLADDNYATIVTAVRLGRGVFDNIRKFLRYMLSSNMGEVVAIFFGVVLAGVFGLTDGSGGIVLPLLATQILWVNLVTDSAPALAMGVDEPDPDVMQRRPRNLNEPIIDRAMWMRVLFIGLVMGFSMLVTIDIFLPGGLVEGHDSLEVSRTAGFTTLVVAQLFNALNSRAADASAFSRLFTNRWLWGAIALTLLLQIAVVHVPFMQTAFGTRPLDLEHWLIALAMGSVVLWAEELVKLVRRLVHRGRAAA
ncbi:cation-translocating P-type ATPase [Aestuariimicrobium soli]|uniref:cation-translocating P-type ATPase n=1 Tax=Aestuariimicrobium soli TaxID=2035834 RepID=UPI003EB85420